MKTALLLGLLGLCGAAEAATCKGTDVAVMAIGDTNYGANSPDDCVQLCIMEMALRWIPQFSKGECSSQGYTEMTESKSVQPPGSPMAMQVEIFAKAAAATSTKSAAAAPTNGGCKGSEVVVSAIGDTNFGASSSSECVQMCSQEFVLTWIPQFSKGDCAGSGYSEKIESKTVQPPGSPMPMQVTTYGKGDTAASAPAAASSAPAAASAAPASPSAGGGYGGGGGMSSYIEMFKNSEEGKLLSDYKEMYVNGEIDEDDELFDTWKNILLTKCPWYKQMQAKAEAGEIEDRFPFLDILKSGSGRTWSGDYDTPDTSGFDMAKVDFGGMKGHHGGRHGGMHGGRHGSSGYHKSDGGDGSHIEAFKKTTQGKWMAKKKLEYTYGDIGEDDIEYIYWKEQLLTDCPWYKFMQKKHERGEIEEGFPFFSYLKSGDGPAWSGDYSNPDTAQMDELHEEFKASMMEGKGHGGRHGGYGGGHGGYVGASMHGAAASMHGGAASMHGAATSMHGGVSMPAGIGMTAIMEHGSSSTKDAMMKDAGKKKKGKKGKKGKGKKGKKGKGKKGKIHDLKDKINGGHGGYHP